MTLFTQLAQSTLAARLACIVLLAALAGLVTKAFLTVAYGAPAPAAVAAPSAEPALTTPNWLAGGVAADVAAPSDFKLVGVIAEGSQSVALVQQVGKRAQTLHIGQKLADGTQLKSVQGKTATLLINKELRTLKLEPTSTAVGTAAINTAIAPPPLPSLAVAVPTEQASAQQAQQIQQLQQAALGDGQARPMADPPIAGNPRRRNRP
jgi:hypothetical protein